MCPVLLSAMVNFQLHGAAVSALGTTIPLPPLFEKFLRSYEKVMQTLSWVNLVMICSVAHRVF